MNVMESDAGFWWAAIFRNTCPFHPVEATLGDYLVSWHHNNDDAGGATTQASQIRQVMLQNKVSQPWDGTFVWSRRRGGC